MDEQHEKRQPAWLRALQRVDRWWVEVHEKKQTLLLIGGGSAALVAVWLWRLADPGDYGALDTRRAQLLLIAITVVGAAPIWGLLRLLFPSRPPAPPAQDAFSFLQESDRQHRSWITKMLALMVGAVQALFWFFFGSS